MCTCLADRAAAASGAGGAAVTREDVLACVLNEMEATLALFAARGFAPLADEYSRRWLHSGQRVRVADKAGGPAHACVIRGETVHGTVHGTAGARGRVSQRGVQASLSTARCSASATTVLGAFAGPLGICRPQSRGPLGAFIRACESRAAPQV